MKTQNIQRLHSALYDNCRFEELEKLKNLLQKSEGAIDITHNDGIFIRFALSSDSKEILSDLLKYFREERLPKLESNQKDLEQFKLKIILQNACDEFDISPELQTIIKPYLPSIVINNAADESGYDTDESGYDTDEDLESIEDPFESNTIEDVPLSLSCNQCYVAPNIITHYQTSNNDIDLSGDIIPLPGH